MSKNKRLNEEICYGTCKGIQLSFRRTFMTKPKPLPYPGLTTTTNRWRRAFYLITVSFVDHIVITIGTFIVRILLNLWHLERYRHARCYASGREELLATALWTCLGLVDSRYSTLGHASPGKNDMLDILSVPNLCMNLFLKNNSICNNEQLFQQQVLSQVQLKKRLEAISRILGFIMRRNSNVWSSTPMWKSSGPLPVDPDLQRGARI